MSAIERIKDLGTWFSDLSFNTYMETMVAKAYKMLGFVLRYCKYFRNIHTLKLPYCAIVRPHLEYGSVVWSPYQESQCIHIERIQHRLLRRTLFWVDLCHFLITIISKFKEILDCCPWIIEETLLTSCCCTIFYVDVLIVLSYWLCLDYTSQVDAFVALLSLPCRTIVLFMENLNLLNSSEYFRKWEISQYWFFQHFSCGVRNNLSKMLI